MYHIKECVVVEGAYDKIRLSTFLDGTIFVTNGFSIFKNKEAIKSIKTLAKNCGIVILTDSDSAGFKIRNFIKQAVGDERVLHAYIPEISGKEKRKTTPGKEGLLGVEGIDEETIINALKNAGCTIDDKAFSLVGERITKTDFFALGLTGTHGSASKRAELSSSLGLPSKMSANMLISAINSIMTKEEFEKFLNKKG